MPSVKRPPKPVDARFHWPRRKRDLAAAFTAQIGWELSPHETVLVSNAAAMAVRLEQIEQDILNGKPVADNQIVRLNNSYRRILHALGLDKTPTTKLRRQASNVSTIRLGRTALGARSWMNTFANALGHLLIRLLGCRHECTGHLDHRCVRRPCAICAMVQAS
jgi:hypothetical protein